MLLSIHCLFEALIELDDEELDCLMKMEQPFVKPLLWLVRHFLALYSL